MGMTKNYTRHMLDAGYKETIQALTQASTGTLVTNHGVTTITSAGSGTAGVHRFLLQEPQKGLRKTVIADLNSTREVAIHNNSTASVFFGSTFNAATFSTGTGIKWIDFVGISNTQWALAGRSTGVTLSASTIGG
jgi:hypothetical protein